MADEQSNCEQGRGDDRSKTNCGRRTFIAVGSGVSATMLAGCTSGGSPDESDGETRTDDETQSDGSTEITSGGNFKLLISDMPADIGDFDRLDVTLDYARIFDGGEGEGEESNETDGEDERSDEGDEPGEQEGSDDNEEKESDEDDQEGAESEDESETETEDEDADDGVERKRGFYILDLEGATVDLTEVIGDKAVSAFEGELAPGTYEKIELHVSAVEGIVDGEQATVKVPSEKLQITHPFEVGADDPVSFVFDINVVKRGKGNEYNLKPVISESGVAGKDVEVDEIDDEREPEEEKDETEEPGSDAGQRDEEEEDDADGNGDDSGDE